MTKETIESEWFEWKTWDADAAMCIVFHKCKLKKNIGKFKKDEAISYINLDCENSTIELLKNKDGTNGVKFKIRLDILEEIK